MRGLWLYDRMDRLGLRNYRAKILVTAFLGTHVPLIALACFVAVVTAGDWCMVVGTLGVTLAATLAGTAGTLLVLDQLLRPIVLTARALRAYRCHRRIEALPAGYTDQAGTLMADAGATLRHLERALQTLEFLDDGTGLPNRRRLVRDLADRFMRQGRFALVALRFEPYARLRETLDRHHAEAAAAEIAHRLRAALGDGMTLYRMGGAEFAVVIAGAAAEPIAAGGCTRAIDALIAGCAGPIDAGALTIEPVLHAGVALHPADAADAEALVGHALAAVAVAGDEAPVTFHSPAARRQAIERLHLEQELRHALANDQFVLHFQPVVDLSRRRTVGAEALIRWRHPDHGLLPPGRFIGVAEAGGLIDAIGLWSLRRACAQVRDWSAAGLPGLKVAVNLSARQFLDPDLTLHVAEAVRAAGIDAGQLEIELTETTAMADHDHTRAVFGRLRDLGVGIAIDDFGTGFAGLSQLRRLPFNKLKIDREFVTGVHATRDNQAICGALMALARGLDLHVLAEGTETAEEVVYLRDAGCALYQGFYFSRPLAPEAFRAGLDRVAESCRALPAHWRDVGREVAMAG